MERDGNRSASSVVTDISGVTDFRDKLTKLSETANSLLQAIDKVILKGHLVRGKKVSHNVKESKRSKRPPEPHAKSSDETTPDSGMSSSEIEHEHLDKKKKYTLMNAQDSNSVNLKAKLIAEMFSKNNQNAVLREDSLSSLSLPKLMPHNIDDFKKARSDGLFDSADCSSSNRRADVNKLGLVHARLDRAGSKVKSCFEMESLTPAVNYGTKKSKTEKFIGKNIHGLVRKHANSEDQIEDSSHEKNSTRKISSSNSEIGTDKVRKNRSKVAKSSRVTLDEITKKIARDSPPHQKSSIFDLTNASSRASCDHSCTCGCSCLDQSPPEHMQSVSRRSIGLLLNPSQSSLSTCRSDRSSKNRRSWDKLSKADRNPSSRGSRRSIGRSSERKNSHPSKSSITCRSSCDGCSSKDRTRSRTDKVPSMNWSFPSKNGLSKSSGARKSQTRKSRSSSRKSSGRSRSSKNRKTDKSSSNRTLSSSSKQSRSCLCESSCDHTRCSTFTYRSKSMSRSNSKSKSLSRKSSRSRSCICGSSCHDNSSSCVPSLSRTSKSLILRKSKDRLSDRSRRRKRSGDSKKSSRSKSSIGGSSCNGRTSKSRSSRRSFCPSRTGSSVTTKTSHMRTAKVHSSQSRNSCICGSSCSQKSSCGESRSKFSSVERTIFSSLVCTTESSARYGKSQASERTSREIISTNEPSGRSRTSCVCSSSCQRKSNCSESRTGISKGSVDVRPSPTNSNDSLNGSQSRKRRTSNKRSGESRSSCVCDSSCRDKSSCTSKDRSTRKIVSTKHSTASSDSCKKSKSLPRSKGSEDSCVCGSRCLASDGESDILSGTNKGRITERSISTSLSPKNSSRSRSSNRGSQVSRQTKSSCNCGSSCANRDGSSSCGGSRGRASSRSGSSKSSRRSSKASSRTSATSCKCFKKFGKDSYSTSNSKILLSSCRLGTCKYGKKPDQTISYILTKPSSIETGHTSSTSCSNCKCLWNKESLRYSSEELPPKESKRTTKRETRAENESTRTRSCAESLALTNLEVYEKSILSSTAPKRRSRSINRTVRPSRSKSINIGLHNPLSRSEDNRKRKTRKSREQSMASTQNYSSSSAEAGSVSINRRPKVKELRPRKTSNVIDSVIDKFTPAIGMRKRKSREPKMKVSYKSGSLVPSHLLARSTNSCTCSKCPQTEPSRYNARSVNRTTKTLKKGHETVLRTSRLKASLTRMSSSQDSSFESEPSYSRVLVNKDASIVPPATKTSGHEVSKHLKTIAYAASSFKIDPESKEQLVLRPSKQPSELSSSYSKKVPPKPTSGELFTTREGSAFICKTASGGSWTNTQESCNCSTCSQQGTMSEILRAKLSEFETVEYMGSAKSDNTSKTPEKYVEKEDIVLKAMSLGNMQASSSSTLSSKSEKGVILKQTRSRTKGDKLPRALRDFDSISPCSTTSGNSPDSRNVGKKPASQSMKVRTEGIQTSHTPSSQKYKITSGFLERSSNESLIVLDLTKSIRGSCTCSRCTSSPHRSLQSNSSEQQIEQAKQSSKFVESRNSICESYRKNIPDSDSKEINPDRDSMAILSSPGSSQLLQNCSNRLIGRFKYPKVDMELSSTDCASTATSDAELRLSHHSPNRSSEHPSLRNVSTKYPEGDVDKCSSSASSDTELQLSHHGPDRPSLRNVSSKYREGEKEETSYNCSSTASSADSQLIRMSSRDSRGSCRSKEPINPNLCLCCQCSIVKYGDEHSLTTTARPINHQPGKEKPTSPEAIERKGDIQNQPSNTEIVELGDPTVRNDSQISLSPRKHPFKTNPPTPSCEDLETVSLNKTSNRLEPKKRRSQPGQDKTEETDLQHLERKGDTINQPSNTETAKGDDSKIRSSSSLSLSPRPSPFKKSTPANLSCRSTEITSLTKLENPLEGKPKNLPKRGITGETTSHLIAAGSSESSKSTVDKYKREESIGRSLSRSVPCPPKTGVVGLYSVKQKGESDLSSSESNPISSIKERSSAKRTSESSNFWNAEDQLSDTKKVLTDQHQKARAIERNQNAETGVVVKQSSEFQRTHKTANVRISSIEIAPYSTTNQSDSSFDVGNKNQTESESDIRNSFEFIQPEAVQSCESDATSTVNQDTDVSTDNRDPVESKSLTSVFNTKPRDFLRSHQMSYAFQSSEGPQLKLLNAKARKRCTCSKCGPKQAQQQVQNPTSVSAGPSEFTLPEKMSYAFNSTALFKLETVNAIFPTDPSRQISIPSESKVLSQNMHDSTSANQSQFKKLYKLKPVKSTLRGSGLYNAIDTPSLSDSSLGTMGSKTFAPIDSKLNTDPKIPGLVDTGHNRSSISKKTKKKITLTKKSKDKVNTMEYQFPPKNMKEMADLMRNKLDPEKKHCSCKKKTKDINRRRKSESSDDLGEEKSKKKPSSSRRPAKRPSKDDETESNPDEKTTAAPEAATSTTPAANTYLNSNKLESCPCQACADAGPSKHCKKQAKTKKCKKKSSFSSCISDTAPKEKASKPKQTNVLHSMKPKRTGSFSSCISGKSEKQEKCPCSCDEKSRKHVVETKVPSDMSAALQQPRVPVPIQLSRDEGEPKTAESVLSRPQVEPEKVVQVIQQTDKILPDGPKDTCICQTTQCDKRKPSLIEIKPLNVSKVFQRPRVPNSAIVDSSEPQSELKQTPPKLMIPAVYPIPSDPLIPAKETCICDGQKRSKPSPIRTKPFNLSTVFQRPRVAHSAIYDSFESGDSEPIEVIPEPSKQPLFVPVPHPINIDAGPSKEKCICDLPREEPKKHKPSPVKTKQLYASNSFQKPRVPQSPNLNTLGNQSDSEKPKLERKPVNSVTVPSETCIYSTCDSTKAPKPSPVKTKPPKISTIFQRRRVPQQSDTESMESDDGFVEMKPKPTQKLKPKPVVDALSPSQEKCICDICDEPKPKSLPVRTKPISIAEIMQRPRVSKETDYDSLERDSEPIEIKSTIPKKPKPKPVPDLLTEGKSLQKETCICDTACNPKPAKPSPVKTKPTSISEMFQKPRVPQQTDYESLESDSEPIEVKSAIVKQPKPRPVMDTATEGKPSKDICICDVCDRKPPKPSPVETKPFSISEMFQKPKVAQQTDFDSLDNDSKPIEVKSITAKQPKPKPLMDPTMGGQPLKDICIYPVKTKPSSASALLQKPRIQQQTDYESPESDSEPIEVKATSPSKLIPKPVSSPLVNPAKETCICDSCDSPKPPKPSPVKTKSFNISNIFKRPRIPTDVSIENESKPKVTRSVSTGKPVPDASPSPPEPPKETCICDSCESEKPPKPSSVRTKAFEMGKLFQRRVPHSIDYEALDTGSEPVEIKSMASKRPQLRPVLDKRPENTKLKQNETCICNECDSSQHPMSIPVKTKPMQMSEIFQKPRVPLSTETKFFESGSAPVEIKSSVTKKPVLKPKADGKPSGFVPQRETCICTACEDPKPKARRVTTKPTNISTKFQRPRVAEPTLTDYNIQTSELVEVKSNSQKLPISKPVSQIGTGSPLKPETGDPARVCTCTVCEDKSRCQRIDCKPAKAESAVTKPVNMANVFQRPRVAQPTLTDYSSQISQPDEVKAESPKLGIPKPVAQISTVPVQSVEPVVGGSGSACTCTVCEDKSRCKTEAKNCKPTKAEPVVSKPINIANVFQRPRVAQPTLTDYSMQTSQPGEVKPESPKLQIPKPVAQVSPAPPNFPLDPAAEEHAPACSCTICEDRSRCKSGAKDCKPAKAELVIMKPGSMANVFQRPRVAQPTLTDYSGQTYQPDEVKIEVPKLQIPKPVPQVDTAPPVSPSYQAAEGHVPACSCTICEDKSRCETEAKDCKPAKAESVIVKPVNVANMFQSPRVAQPTLTDYSNQISQPDEVKPKSPKLQIPKPVAQVSTLPVQPVEPVEGGSGPACTCTVCEDKSRCKTGAKNSMPAKAEPVVSKPINIANVFQRPRVAQPTLTDYSMQTSQPGEAKPESPKLQIPKPVAQVSPAPPNFPLDPAAEEHAPACSCTICEDRSRCKSGAKDCKPAKAELVIMKPGNMANVFQRPRVAQPTLTDYSGQTSQPDEVKIEVPKLQIPKPVPQVDTAPPVSPSYQAAEGHVPACSCTICEDKSRCETEAKDCKPAKAESEIVKPVNVANMFQSPRVAQPTLTDYSCQTFQPVEVKANKPVSQINTDLPVQPVEPITCPVCTCSICEDRSRCKTGAKDCKPAKAEPVITKRVNMANVFQRPRVALPNLTDYNIQIYQPDEIKPESPKLQTPKLVAQVGTIPPLTTVEQAPEDRPGLSHPTLTGYTNQASELDEVKSDFPKTPTPKPVDDMGPSSDVTGEGAPICTCKVCEDRSRCKTPAKDCKPVKAEHVIRKPVSMANIFQRPRVTQATLTDYSEQSSEPVEFKGNTSSEIFQPNPISNTFKFESCNCKICEDKSRCQNRRRDSASKKKSSWNSCLPRSSGGGNTEGNSFEQPSKANNTEIKQKNVLMQNPRRESIKATDHSKRKSDSVELNAANLKPVQHAVSTESVDVISACQCATCEDKCRCQHDEECKPSKIERISLKPTTPFSVLQRPRLTRPTLTEYTISDRVQSKPKVPPKPSKVSNIIKEPPMAVEKPPMVVEEPPQNTGIFQKPRVPIPTQMDYTGKSQPVETKPTLAIQKPVVVADHATSCVCHKYVVNFKTEDVDTKPIGISNVFQRPRLPEPTLTDYTVLNSSPVEIKTSTNKSPTKLPSQAPSKETPHSDKCTCTICADRSRCQNPQKCPEKRSSWASCLPGSNLSFSENIPKEKAPEPERISFKPSISSGIFQRPRVPSPTLTDYIGSKSEPVETKPKVAKLGKPVVAEQGSLVSEKPTEHGPTCRCDQCEGEFKTDIVQTKPKPLLYLFQRPRLAKPTLTECSRQKSSPVEMKPSSNKRSSKPQKKPPQQEQCTCTICQEKFNCENPHECSERKSSCLICIPKSSASSSGKLPVGKPPKPGRVNLKSSNATGFFQRPRVPSPTLTEYTDLITEPVEIKPKEAQTKGTKPIDIIIKESSVQLPPKSPSKVSTFERHPEVCSCDKCLESRLKMQPVKVKSTPSNVWQRPRVPIYQSESSVAKTTKPHIEKCTCNICQNRARCKAESKDCSSEEKWSCTRCFSQSETSSSDKEPVHVNSTNLSTVMQPAPEPIETKPSSPRRSTGTILETIGQTSPIDLRPAVPKIKPPPSSHIEQTSWQTEPVVVKPTDTKERTPSKTVQIPVIGQSSKIDFKPSTPRALKPNPRTIHVEPTVGQSESVEIKTSTIIANSPSPKNIPPKVPKPFVTHVEPTTGKSQPVLVKPPGTQAPKSSTTHMEPAIGKIEPVRVKLPGAPVPKPTATQVVSVPAQTVTPEPPPTTSHIEPSTGQTNPVAVKPCYSKLSTTDIPVNGQDSPIFLKPDIYPDEHDETCHCNLCNEQYQRDRRKQGPIHTKPINMVTLFRRPRLPTPTLTEHVGRISHPVEIKSSSSLSVQDSHFEECTCKICEDQKKCKTSPVECSGKKKLTCSSCCYRRQPLDTSDSSSDKPQTIDQPQPIEVPAESKPPAVSAQQKPSQQNPPEASVQKPPQEQPPQLKPPHPRPPQLKPPVEQHAIELPLEIPAQQKPPVAEPSLVTSTTSKTSQPSLSTDPLNIPPCRCKLCKDLKKCRARRHRLASKKLSSNAFPLSSSSPQSSLKRSSSSLICTCKICEAQKRCKPSTSNFESSYDGSGRSSTASITSSAHKFQPSTKPALVPQRPNRILTQSERTASNTSLYFSSCLSFCKCSRAEGFDSSSSHRSPLPKPAVHGPDTGVSESEKTRSSSTSYWECTHAEVCSISPSQDFCQPKKVASKWEQGTSSALSCTSTFKQSELAQISQERGSLAPWPPHISNVICSCSSEENISLASSYNSHSRLSSRTSGDLTSQVICMSSSVESFGSLSESISVVTTALPETEQAVPVHKSVIHVTSPLSSSSEDSFLSPCVSKSVFSVKMIEGTREAGLIPSQSSLETEVTEIDSTRLIPPDLKHHSSNASSTDASKDSLKPSQPTSLPEHVSHADTKPTIPQLANSTSTFIKSTIYKSTTTCVTGSIYSTEPPSANVSKLESVQITSVISESHHPALPNWVSFMPSFCTDAQIRHTSAEGEPPSCTVVTGVTSHQIPPVLNVAPSHSKPTNPSGGPSQKPSLPPSTCGYEKPGTSQQPIVGESNQAPKAPCDCPLCQALNSELESLSESTEESLNNRDCTTKPSEPNRCGCLDCPFLQQSVRKPATNNHGSSACTDRKTNPEETARKIRCKCFADEAQCKCLSRCYCNGTACVAQSNREVVRMMPNDCKCAAYGGECGHERFGARDAFYNVIRHLLDSDAEVNGINEAARTLFRFVFVELKHIKGMLHRGLNFDIAEETNSTSDILNIGPNSNCAYSNMQTVPLHDPCIFCCNKAPISAMESFRATPASPLDRFHPPKFPLTRTILSNPCENNAPPATILSVRPVGNRSLMVTWMIVKSYNIGGYEILIDGCLKCRTYSPKRNTAIVCGVDVNKKHQVRVIAVPEIGILSRNPQALRASYSLPSQRQRTWSHSYFYEPRNLSI